MLCSYYDQCFRSRDFGGFGSAFADNDRMFELGEEERKSWLVRNFAPWYLKYYVSWLSAAENPDLPPVLFLDYDDFAGNPAATVERILAFHELSLPRPRIDEALEVSRGVRSELRFNKGVSGRGAAFFSAEQREHVRELAATYVRHDFEGLGLI
jgi:hypothetical protein